MKSADQMESTRRIQIQYYCDTLEELENRQERNTKLYTHRQK